MVANTAAPDNTAAPVNTTAPATAMPEATAMQATAMPAGTPGGGTTMDWSKVGAELADAYAGKLKGTKVTMYGPFTGEDEIQFNNSIKDFEAAKGIDIQY
jgi:alpha-glucoside transport system substrate-binding protein